MNKFTKMFLCFGMILSLLTFASLDTSALNIIKVDQNSAIAKEFSFQPCVTTDTKIAVDQSFNHFSDNYILNTNFKQPVTGDDYCYRIELKKNDNGTYKYADASKQMMPSIRYIYENVGMYEGEIVNARVTLDEIIDTYRLETNATTHEVAVDPNFDHFIYIDHAGIGFCAGRCKVTIEFLKEDGSLIPNFKGNVTGTDLDSGQGVYNVTGVNTIYYKNNTIITATTTGVQSNGNAASGMYDENGQFLMLVNSAKITFDWCKQKSSTSPKWSEGRYISFQKAGFLRNVTPGPSKEVDKKIAKVEAYNGKEVLIYTLSQYVPYQPIGYSYNASGMKVTGQDYHYTMFKLVDTFEKCGTVDTNKIKVVNDAEEDVTSHFNFILNGNTVEIQAKEDYMLNEAFYAHTYLVTLPVEIDETKLVDYTNDGTYVKNNVTLYYSQFNGGNNVNGGSDQATSEFVFNIDSKCDQGSMITPSIHDIKGGNSANFEYQAKDGYYITHLIVDGKEVECSKEKGSYSFGNINQYHTIEVVSHPYYEIKTDVINGTISPNQISIEAGEDRVIEYKADENCYLETIKVDGNIITSKEHEMNYSFQNISDNHHIEVIYTPYNYIKTAAINGFISGDHQKMLGNRNEGSYEQLRKGSNVLVTYQPRDGYYLKEIIISKLQYNTQSKLYDRLETTHYDSYELFSRFMNQYAFNNIDHSYEITVVYQPNPIISITKTIEGDYNLANCIPTSIFRISGKDYTGKSHIYYRVISFKDMVENNRLKENSITIKDRTIPSGNYIIEEMEVSRYTLIDTINHINCSIFENKAMVNTVLHNEIHVEFINQQTNFKDYSHNDVVVNNIH